MSTSRFLRVAPNSGYEQVQQSSDLFDDLIGARENSRRHIETEHLRHLACCARAARGHTAAAPLKVPTVSFRSAGSLACTPAQSWPVQGEKSCRWAASVPWFSPHRRELPTWRAFPHAVRQLIGCGASRRCK